MVLLIQWFNYIDLLRSLSTVWVGFNPSPFPSLNSSLVGCLHSLKTKALLFWEALHPPLNTIVLGTWLSLRSVEHDQSTYMHCQSNLSWAEGCLHSHLPIQPWRASPSSFLCWSTSHFLLILRSMILCPLHRPLHYLHPCCHLHRCCSRCWVSWSHGGYRAYPTTPWRRRRQSKTVSSIMYLPKIPPRYLPCTLTAGVSLVCKNKI